MPPWCSQGYLWLIKPSLTRQDDGTRAGLVEIRVHAASHGKLFGGRGQPSG